MADVRWGQGSSAETDTGILEVLLAFVAQGGQLYGARRWEENPLTLTHVRWQGLSGGLLDAFRQPGSTVSGDDVESNVWIQLALNFPSSHPSAAGMDAPGFLSASIRQPPHSGSTSSGKVLASVALAPAPLRGRHSRLDPLCLVLIRDLRKWR